MVDPPKTVIVTVGTVSAALCAAGQVAIPFTVNTPLASDNVFTAQLSNASGAFPNPVTIGKFAGNNSDTIRAKIPADALSGTGYRIRILSNYPKDTSLPNSLTLSINYAPNQPVAINGKSDVCLGTQTYTASPAGNRVLNTCGNCPTADRWTRPAAMRP